MKNFRKIICAILVIACMFGLCMTYASADSGSKLKRANELFDPEGTSREEEKAKRIKALWEDLSYEAYCAYEYMAIPDLRDMLEEPETRYVQGTYGQGIYACDAPDGERLDSLDEGTKLTVYARHGNYSFVKTENDYVCWCKSSLLAKNFNQEMSLMRLWDWQARHGIS